MTLYSMRYLDQFQAFRCNPVSHFYTTSRYPDTVTSQATIRNRNPAATKQAKFVSGSGTGSTGIAARLRREILEGSYAYRERLPSERELAIRFGAARGTIRAALQQLESMRLVTRRAGSGTFVRYRGHADREDIAEITSPLELIEVRLAMEPPLARLAVMHANAQDLQRLADALARVESAVDDPELFSRNDEAFHLTLAESTRNPLMLSLYRQINDVRGHTQWNARKDKILTSSRIAEYNRQHRDLYLAIASRDIEGAVATITRHLEQARADLLGVS